ncbi:MAG: ABC transporter permease [Erysipelotrichaceae bacterium]|nr:ABC transporter permease [Erysipelotrichaceae bacterium]
MALSTFVGSIELGCIFAILSLGLFIAFRILNLPDLTVDGSFVTGVALASVFTVKGHPVIGLVMAMVGAGLAGFFTGIFHTKLKIHEILAGILTMTALYSINLHLMEDKPSIFFYGEKTVFSFAQGKLMINGVSFGVALFLLVVVALLTYLLYYFLRTQVGMSLRATGDNEAMVRSSSINTDAMKILGFVLCNAIVGLSGGLYAEYTQTGTYTVGTGMLVLALASIIIGETVFGKRGMLRHLISVSLGAILYRIMLTFAFQLGLPVNDLKLFSACIVIAAISIPLLKDEMNKRRKRHAKG